jgi:hypothetical protein
MAMGDAAKAQGIDSAVVTIEALETEVAAEGEPELVA